MISRPVVAVEEQMDLEMRSCADQLSQASSPQEFSPEPLIPNEKEEQQDAFPLADAAGKIDEEEAEEKERQEGSREEANNRKSRGSSLGEVIDPSTPTPAKTSPLRKLSIGMKLLTRSFSSREMAESDCSSTASVFGSIPGTPNFRSLSFRRSTSGSRGLFQTAEDNRGGRDSLTEPEAEEIITTPISTSHTLHVTYNADLARFEGLEGAPKEWRSMNKQFGVSLHDVPKTEVEGYEGKIPAVLVMLKNQLLAKGGVHSVGVFRLAPDKEACDAVKEQINNGDFDGEADVNTIANLIKVWFRQCPDALFEGIKESYMSKINNMNELEEVDEEMKHLPEVTRCLIYWVLDLMALVVMQEAENKMSAKNMAIVMAPNFFRVKDDANPMSALTLTHLVNDFTHKLLLARLKLHHHYIPPPSPQPTAGSSNGMVSLVALNRQHSLPHQQQQECKW